MLLLKRPPVRILTATLALMLLPSCRKLVLEDRMDCPGYLYFQMKDSRELRENTAVRTDVFLFPEGVEGNTGTSSVGQLSDADYYMKVKKAETWTGYGLAGLFYCKSAGDGVWRVEKGQEWDPLFVFRFSVPGSMDEVRVPVEFTKEHSRVTVKFVNAEALSGPGGRFPWELVVRGGTSGYDAINGIPVKGDYFMRPMMTDEGTFEFILPRPADGDLFMEIHPRSGGSGGPIDTFNLYSLLELVPHTSWAAKNLPDYYIEFDYVEAGFEILLLDWYPQTDLYYEL